MKKLLILALLAPTLTFASVTWSGYKLIQSQATGLCLKAPTTFPTTGMSIQDTDYATYATCDAHDKNLHWSNDAGKLGSRPTGMKLSWSTDILTYYVRLTSGYPNPLYISDAGELVNGSYRAIMNTNGTAQNRSKYGNQAYMPHNFLSADAYESQTNAPISNYNPATQRLVGFTGKMNGGGISGPYEATFSPIVGGKVDAYMTVGPHTKVISLVISGSNIRATGAKYRAGGYIADATDYLSMPLATSATGSGYGLYDLEAKTSIDLKFLGTQANLTAKLNTLEFLKTIYNSTSKDAALDVANGFWIDNINLAENTSEIPTGSLLRLSRSALWDTTFKNQFRLQAGVDYLVSYNGKTWDISRNLGAAYITTAGMALPESSSTEVLNITGNMNGSWVGGDYAFRADYLGASRYNLYIEAGNAAKVVEVQIGGGVIKATSAKYRIGGYDRFATDYNPLSVAASASDGGYGVHDLAVTLGSYVPKKLSMRDYAGNQDDLTSKLNSLNFYKTIFTRPNVLDVNIENYYWVQTLTLPSNTNGIANGSVVKFKSTAAYDSTINGTNLARNVVYTYTYNGSGWVLSQ